MLQTCEACGERPASTSGLCAACALSSRPSSGFASGPDRRAPLLPLLGAAASALALLLGAAYAERLAQGDTVGDPVAWLKRRRGGTPTLDGFARDLTAAAKAGELDPVIGRDEEIERVVAVLARRTKNNPVLVGEPGVGKTAIVEGLAQRIVRGQVPASLREKRVLALSVGSLVAGTKYRGEMESRVKRILDEVRERSRDVVLFIDELHTLVGAGAAEGALDLSSMIKPELARGDLQCIGATTFDEYRKYIEADAALERRFQPVMVGEPSIDETAAILFGLRRSYEHHHGVVIQDDAVRAAASLSARYIADRRLPDKAIDLMDEAASSAALNSARAVTRADVSAIISKWTGIPQGDVDQEQARGLLDLERALGERVIGQEAAIETVAHAVRRGRTGLKDPRRPLGGFLFVGPSGVGKTELAKALAIVLFGTEDAVVRLDLSEYSQPHSISRLVGAPPGYAGHDEPGQLTEPVRRRPYCVVLLDAFDKTHADVAAMLLQILDDGRLTDAKGRAVDFRHAIVILTSNADPEELALTTAPELLNRIDDIVRFDSLDIDSIERIVELQMRGVEERLEDRGITLLLSDAARRYIARESMAAGDGARHVGRTIARLVTTPLSGALLRDEIREGAAARVELLGETIAFLTSPEFAD